MGALIRENEVQGRKVSLELQALEGVLDQDKKELAAASLEETQGLRTQMADIDKQIQDLTKILHEEWSKTDGEMSAARAARLKSLSGARNKLKEMGSERDEMIDKTLTLAQMAVAKDDNVERSMEDEMAWVLSKVGDLSSAENRAANDIVGQMAREMLARENAIKEERKLTLEETKEFMAVVSKFSDTISRVAGTAADQQQTLGSKVEVMEQVLDAQIGNAAAQQQSRTSQ